MGVLAHKEMRVRERPLIARKLVFADIAEALRQGSLQFQALPFCSIAYASVFVLLGLVLLTVMVMLGLSPMVLPLAGGFMLLGPVLLSGYFELALRYEQGRPGTLGGAFTGFFGAPSALWSVALVCALLFLIWITDAGTLYSFTLGGAHYGPDLGWLVESGQQVLYFELWSALMGAVLAYMIFVVSAFSVPLLYERRCGLVRAISASARAVLGNFLVTLAWGLLLGILTISSVLLLPVLLASLPVMAYASFSLYRKAFPVAQESA